MIAASTQTRIKWSPFKESVITQKVMINGNSFDKPFEWEEQFDIGIINSFYFHLTIGNNFVEFPVFCNIN